jgi:two-component system sensor histidine kinase GlrK
MPSYRPRSIVSLILLGFAVVLTPFIAAVVTAVVEVDKLAQEGRAALREAHDAADESRILVQQALNMQRALGQYQFSDSDRELFEIYLDQRNAFRAALDSLVGLKLEGLEGTRLSALDSRERAIYAAVGGNAGILPDGNSWSDISDSLDQLRSDARAVADAGNRLIEVQADAATRQAESVQRLVLALTAAAVPATIFLVGLFTALITRPMKTLGIAIRRLGDQTLTDPVSVSGPKDIEALGRELEWLRRRIQLLEEQKTSFLRHISHELKTPLTTLREGSELLVETLGGDQQEEAEIARLMQVSSVHLQGLIENLLKFARTLELTNDLELETGVGLAALVRSSVATQRLAADAKDIDIDLRLSPVAVRGDRNKLRVVIENLLANAVKFTPPDGSIIVTLAADGEWARLDVEDTGPGIAEADRERIFEPFQQGNADAQGSVKGTGLGLAIVRDYLDAHAGTISCVPADRGAHFMVRIPIAGPGPDAEGRME